MRPSTYASLKRSIDITVSAVALLLIWPVLLLILAAVRLGSKGPAIFKQVRVGMNNSHFVIYKFRTMRVDTPDVAKSLLSHGDPRITRIGHFLRRTSLDEFPQLVNVLKGDMSLVGPRPALYNQHDLIAMRTKAGVHRALPGLTGMAQIHGREALTLEEKVALDRHYVENASIWLDMWILLRTPAALLSSRGTY